MGRMRAGGLERSRLTLVLVAAVTALLLVVAVGAAQAQGAVVTHGSSATDVNASGTLDCSVSKGKLVVDPGLVFGGTATSVTFAFSGKLTCTGTSGVTGGTFNATGTAATNDCGTLAGVGIPTLTATVDWKGKFNPSTIVFSDGNFSIGSSLSILLPSTGPDPATGSAIITGSFADEPAAATFVADQTIGVFESGCESTSGLTGFTFTGVHGTSTLDISQQQTVTPPAPPASGPVTVGVDASSPGTSINQNLIGFNHPVAGSEGALQAIGTTWARTDVSFEVDAGTSQAAYDCTTGAWNPSYTDSNVAIDNAAGAQVELIVDYFPPCIEDQTVAANRTAWKKLVYQMALHEITAEGVRVFEVWNEPNFRDLSLNGKGGYLELYKNTATELEKAAAVAGVSIEVGGPAVDDLGQIDNSWVVALASYAVKNHLPLDFVAWHQYPNDPDEGPQSFVPDGVCETGIPVGGQPCWYNPNFDVTLYQRGAESLESALAQFPTLHPLLWVDEWAPDSGNDVRESGPLGAAFVAAALNGAQQSGIARMSYYDVADDPTDPTYSNFGVLTGDLAPKPVYYAFSMWHQLTGAELPVTLTPDQSASAPVGQIGSVASVAPDGTVHVMVYNWVPYDATGGYGTTDPTPYDHQVTVNLSGLSAGTYGLTRTLVDGNDNDATVDTDSVSGPSTSVTFTLAGEGVTLVTLSPQG